MKPDVLHAQRFLLILNAGSSSLKFSLFGCDSPPARILSGAIDRVGSPKATFTLKPAQGGRTASEGIPAPNHVSALDFVLERLAEMNPALEFAAAGHRVVHGGSTYCDPQLVDPAMLAELRRIGDYDPEHLPAEIALMEAVAARFPKVPQIACFDTAFHSTMPRTARLLAIPRRFFEKGVQRYGFHGLSYAFLMEELARVAGPDAARGRVVLAHLGNGASVAAVKDGSSIDTSMAFTPTSGLPMSTRSGDLDPGLLWYLARAEQMSGAELHNMVNRESGLLGVSETSSDIRDLLARENADPRAAEAVALFCYQAKKCIGAYAAALGGLDTLVFSGGIGENAAPVRARICAGLDFLGIDLDGSRNASQADVISTDASRVTVRIIRTDEELMIARSVCRLLGRL